MGSDAEYAAALAAGQVQRGTEIRAQGVRYVPERDAVEIVTVSNAGLLIPREWIGTLQLERLQLAAMRVESVYLWEGLEELPTEADNAVRLVLREVLCEVGPPLVDGVRQIAAAHPPERYQYRRQASDWARDGPPVAE